MKLSITALILVMNCQNLLAQAKLVKAGDPSLPEAISASQKKVFKLFEYLPEPMERTEAEYKKIYNSASDFVKKLLADFQMQNQTKKPGTYVMPFIGQCSAFVLAFDNNKALLATARHCFNVYAEVLMRAAQRPDSLKLDLKIVKAIKGFPVNIRLFDFENREVFNSSAPGSSTRIRMMGYEGSLAKIFPKLVAEGEVEFNSIGKTPIAFALRWLAHEQLADMAVLELTGAPAWMKERVIDWGTIGKSKQVFTAGFPGKSTDSDEDEKINIQTDEIYYSKGYVFDASDYTNGMIALSQDTLRKNLNLQDVHVEKIKEAFEASSILSDAVSFNGMSGGPLLNEHGQVVGMNIMGPKIAAKKRFKIHKYASIAVPFPHVIESLNYFDKN